MYVKLVLTLLVLLAAAVVVALARPRAAPPAEVEDPLDARVPVLKVDGLPLGRAVMSLHETTRANIVVKWDQLAAHGLTPDTAVDADVRDITLLSALRVVFEQRQRAAPNGGRGSLSYATRDGVVTIADAAADPPPLVVRVYDVRDLVSDEYFSRLPRRPWLGRADAVPGGDADGLDDRMAVLVQLVARSGWNATGGYNIFLSPPGALATLPPRPRGPAPSISGFAGRLVIVDTPEAQRETETILRKLREAK